MADIAAAVLDRGIQASRFAWDVTRTSLQLAITNSHPEMELKNSTRYTDGECTVPPAAFISPNNQMTASFEAAASKTKTEGCLMYQIRRAGGITPITKELHLLLAWKIKLGSNICFKCRLIENDVGAIQWDRHHLKGLYYSEIKKDMHSSTSSQSRTWNLETTVKFTVDVTMNDARQGVMNVSIRQSDDELENGRPFFFDPASADQGFRGGFEYGRRNSLQRLWPFMSSATISLRNQMDNLLLRAPDFKMFSGKCVSEVRDIPCNGRDTVFLKSKSTSRGRTRGCLLYELVYQPRPSKRSPVLFGRRTFIAIDVCITRGKATSRKAAIEIITVKDSAFPHCTGKPIDKAHTEVLFHFMNTSGRPSKVHLDELDLKLDVEFNREPHAHLEVILAWINDSEMSKRLFVPFGEYSVPLQSEDSDIQVDPKRPKDRVLFAENRVTNGNHRFLLNIFGENKPGKSAAHGPSNSRRLRPGQHYRCTYTEPDSATAFEQICEILPEQNACSAKGSISLLLDIYVEKSSSQPNGKEQEKEHVYDAIAVYAPYKTRSRACLEHLFKAYRKRAPENARKFDSGHLLEQTVQLSDNHQAHLSVYQAVHLPHLLSVTLREAFNVDHLYKRTSEYNLVEAPSPYRIRITVCNRHPELRLKLADFMASGNTPPTKITTNWPAVDTHQASSNVISEVQDDPMDIDTVADDVNKDDIAEATPTPANSLECHFAVCHTRCNSNPLWFNTVVVMSTPKEKVNAARIAADIASIVTK
ncbi:hypothetical protein THASP1DRAFT_33458 [Thamnocephalis sphaerospora]|uniref:Uncharacterized protein n=1 Tax=Thamnocephalis sphaerospora TaxID=78915 RepID=A0A4P9XGM0_9FUNG|nr:hypothetical protein THASP1DRAFT_33458 [Thamnocephalis sphaerospora]|eukprot:RKP04738.1 hypothetical protein THASP1DRAFT_33458 [Thamnocephalis sphaerospora]